MFLKSHDTGSVPNWVQRRAEPQRQTLRVAGTMNIRVRVTGVREGENYDYDKGQWRWLCTSALTTHKFWSQPRRLT